MEIFEIVRFVNVE